MLQAIGVDDQSAARGEPNVSVFQCRLVVEQCLASIDAAGNHEAATRTGAILRRPGHGIRIRPSGSIGKPGL